MSNMIGLFPRLKDELLEIAIGDEYEDLVTSDTVKRANGVVYGILKDLVDDFLVVDCCYLDKNGTIQFGNIIYINAWAIKMMTKVKSNGSLHDVMMSSSHTSKIKRLLLSGK